jgi:hypothetical protein
MSTREPTFYSAPWSRWRQPAAGLGAVLVLRRVENSRPLNPVTFVKPVCTWSLGQTLAGCQNVPFHKKRDIFRLSEPPRGGRKARMRFALTTRERPPPRCFELPNLAKEHPCLLRPLTPPRFGRSASPSVSCNDPSTGWHPRSSRRRPRMGTLRASDDRCPPPGVLRSFCKAAAWATCAS